MMRWFVVLSAGVMMVVQGCGTDPSEQIVDLQKQLSLLSRQVEQDRKEINDLHTVDAGLRQSLEAAEAELNRLKALETPPPTARKGSINEEELTVMPVPMPKRPQPKVPLAKALLPKRSYSVATAQVQNTPVLCSQVWALVGKGKTEAETAKALRTTVARIRSCERQVGRNRGR